MEMAGPGAPAGCVLTGCSPQGPHPRHIHTCPGPFGQAQGDAHDPALQPLAELSGFCPGLLARPAGPPLHVRAHVPVGSTDVAGE